MRSSRVLIVVALVAACALVWFLRAERRGPSLAPSDATSPVEPAANRPVPAELRTAGASPSELEPAEAREPAPIHVAESAPSTRRVSFRVTDPEDAPLADAHLRTWPPSPGWEGTTDAEGRAEFLAPVSLVELHLEVEHDGYAHLRVERDAREPIEVVLAHALTVRGLVSERETHRPLPGAVVEREHESCSGCAPDRAVADAEGRYELPGIPCGSAAPFVNVRASAPDHATLQRGFVIPRQAPEHRLDLELEPGVELHGRVVDFQGGAPVGGAEIEFGLDSVACDAEGRFATRRAPARAPRLELAVRAEGFCELRIPYEGLDFPLLVRLPRAARVGGIVRDSAGAALPGASVSLWDQGAFDPERPAELDALPSTWRVLANGEGNARSDERGEFHLDGLVPGYESYALDVLAEGHQEAVVPLGALRPGEEAWREIVLVPLERATVFGAFTLNGEPVDGRVAWRTEGGPNDEVPVQDGAYRIENAPVGALTLLALPHGDSLRIFLPESEVELAPVAGTELRHDFHLVLPMAPIAGRVRFSDGRPMPHADVRVRKEGAGVARAYAGPAPWSVSARTDGDGNFRTSVPARDATFAASVRLGSVVRERAALAAGSEDVELVLPVAAELDYRALDRGSRAPISVGLLWRPAGQGEFEWAVPEGGRDPDGFVRTFLPAGAVDLYMNGALAGYLSDSRDGLRLEAGAEPTRVTFELDAGHTLVLQLEPPLPLPREAFVTLPPAEFWSALVLDPNGPRPNSLVAGGRFPALTLGGLFFDKTGRGTVRGLAPRRYRLKAFHASLVFEPDEVTVPAEGPVVIHWARR